MVSVLPAHIALEMKTEMLKKTRKAQMKSMMANHENYSQDFTIKKVWKFLEWNFFINFKSIENLQTQKRDQLY